MNIFLRQEISRMQKVVRAYVNESILFADMSSKGSNSVRKCQQNSANRQKTP